MTNSTRINLYREALERFHAFKRDNPGLNLHNPEPVAKDYTDDEAAAKWVRDAVERDFNRRIA